MLGLHFHSSPVAWERAKSMEQVKSEEWKEPVKELERSKFILQSEEELQVNSEREGSEFVTYEGCWKVKTTSGAEEPEEERDWERVWKVHVSERISSQERFGKNQIRYK